MAVTENYTAAYESFMRSLNSFDDGPEPARKKRRSRWAADNQKVFVYGLPTFIPPGLAPEALDALLIRLRIEEITQRLTAGNLEIDTSEDRSPSPEPIYNSQGIRTNTREQRTRDALNAERQKLVNIATRLNPLFKPPADYKPTQQRKYKKIFIPIDKFPEYNFIGLIIGPRGLTQKNMEKDSGAKIAIRGKGSVKDGKGRMDGKFNSGEDEPLHVLITADTDEQIARAADMVEKLLVPIPEEKNEHKKNQLRKLAEINGTLRDHMNFSLERNSYAADVNCAICGESSHPTADCPLKGKGGVPTKAKLDQEYESFLSEIGGLLGSESAPAPPPSGQGQRPPPPNGPPGYPAYPVPPQGYPGFPGYPPHVGGYPPQPYQGGPPGGQQPGAPLSEEYNQFLKELSHF